MDDSSTTMETMWFPNSSPISEYILEVIMVFALTLERISLFRLAGFLGSRNTISY